MDEKPTNTTFLIDGALALVGLGLIASYGWPLAILLLPAFWVQKVLRKSPAAQEWGRNVLKGTPIKLLPPPTLPKQSSLPATRYTSPSRALRAAQQVPNNALPVNVNNPNAGLRFWDRITNAANYEMDTITPPAAIERKKQTIEATQLRTLQEGLRRLPRYLSYRDLPDTIPSKLSVPIGMDALTGEIVWGDFDANSDQARILHAMIAGQTGSGKDALLRLWFTTLTLNNTPAEIQFVIIDGKTDWLGDTLAQSAYMAIPPAGGIELVKRDGKRVDLAKERIADNLDWVFEEIDRRGKAFRAVGAVSMPDYNRKAAQRNLETLPMIFLIAADIGGSFDESLEMLINLLAMKGRSFGIRMIINVQNPVGENTKWRSQVGFVMSGYQQNPDHDRYIMGVDKSRALLRPSQLPNPEEYDYARGLFIVRQGTKQYFVRTPHLPEEVWDDYIDSSRFIKRWVSPSEQNSMLAQLLEAPMPKATRRLVPVAPQQAIQQQAIQKVNPRDMLTHEQIILIANLTRQGVNKSEIMQRHLGFTNGATYREKLPAVEAIISSVRGRYA